MSDDLTVPFSQDAPASNIGELLQFLLSEQSDQHYFRGQTRFYANSTPSSLRYSMTGSSSDGWVDLSSDFGYERPARDRAKTTFRQKLLLGFGKVVGNLLCQQYGVTSDAYDITADPAIAAFFATRAYPEYDPFEPQTDSDLGVIYRFTITKTTPPSLEVMERTLLWLYLLDESSGRRIYFDDVKGLRQRVLTGKMRGYTREDLEAFLDGRFPLGYTYNQLLRGAAYLSYDIIESAFLQRAAQMQLTGAEALIRSSRTYRQRGGLYFPPTMHGAFFSHHVTVEPIDDRDFVARPGAAETMGAQRVFNINANPYVECFFFKHSKESSIEVDSLDLLWPSSNEDFLLGHLVEVCEHTVQNYLVDFQTDPLNYDSGLIDPGFRSRTPAA